MFSANNKNNKTFIALTDADGCIYNENYMHLLLYVFSKYHKILYNYGRDASIYQTNKNIGDIEINKMIDELHTLTAYQEGEAVKLQNVKSVDDLAKDLLIAHGYNPERLKIDDMYTILTDTKIRYMQYISNMGEAGQRLLNALMLAANKPFLAEIKQRVVSENYNKFILMCGSNRQSKALDDVNNEEFASGSFMVTLSVLLEQFKLAFASNENQIECILDKFLMADLYGKHKAGTSFELIEKECQNKLLGISSDIEHSHYIFDKQKFSLLYAVLHYICNKLPEDNITLAFFEDTKEIYFALMQTFDAHPDLLPKNKNLTLECWPYFGNLPQNKAVKTNNINLIEKGCIYSVQGTGEVDKNFVENVRKIAELSGYDEENKPSINPISDMDMDLFKRVRVLNKQEEKIENLTSIFANNLTLFVNNDAVSSQTNQTQESQQTLTPKTLTSTYTS